MMLSNCVCTMQICRYVDMYAKNKHIYIYILVVDFLQSAYLLGVMFCIQRMDLDTVLCSCIVWVLDFSHTLSKYVYIYIYVCVCNFIRLLLSFLAFFCQSAIYVLVYACCTKLILIGTCISQFASRLPVASLVYPCMASKNCKYIYIYIHIYIIFKNQDLTRTKIFHSNK